MPFNFSGQVGNKVAKLGVVSDGEVFTVGSDGYTLTSNLSQYTAFTANPVHTGTGTWSITTKDNVPRVISGHVETVLASGHYLSTQMNTSTTVSATGQLVLNWTFNVAGTPTDLPSGGQFQIFLQYSETSVRGG